MIKRIAITVVAILFLSLAAFGQTATCVSEVTTAGTAIATGLTSTTFLDTTVVDGSFYGYVVTATDPWGYSCSNQLLNVGIPATGTHSVSLSWIASTTPGVNYAVFRASAPTPPTSATATVN